MKFSVAVEVTPKEGISDPQGLTIEQALPRLGFTGISELRAGKLFTFTIEADSEESALARVEAACARVLANPVIEQFHVRTTVLEEVL